MPERFIAVYDSPYTGITVGVVGGHPSLAHYGYTTEFDVLWTRVASRVEDPNFVARWYSRNYRIPEIVNFLD